MIGADPDPEAFGTIVLATADIQRDMGQAGLSVTAALNPDRAQARASGFITSNGTALGIIEQAR